MKIITPIFSTDVKSVLLCECNEGEGTTAITSKLQTLVLQYLRRMMGKGRIKLSNAELWAATGEKAYNITSYNEEMVMDRSCC